MAASNNGLASHVLYHRRKGRTYIGNRLWRPNALGISGGAPVDREGGRVDSRFQNRADLGGAKRRPLHALVGPPCDLAL